jgi:hypothetical protein
MQRAASSPEIVEALKMFDGWLAFDELDGPGRCQVGDQVLGKLLHWSVEYWPREALRTMLVTFLRLAPAEDLAELMDVVREEAALLERYRAERAAEGRPSNAAAVAELEVH